MMITSGVVAGFIHPLVLTVVHVAHSFEKLHSNIAKDQGPTSTDQVP